jgi:hypothetical protein
VSFANKNQAFLASWVARIQELEDACWSVLNAMTLGTAYGDILEKIGSKVGEPRLGRIDADYLAGIRVRIAVNISKGRSEDLIAIARLVFPTFLYDEYFPASWQITAFNVFGFPRLAQLFGIARSAATYGVMVYSTWDPLQNFVFGSVYGSTPGLGGWSSSYGGAGGGKLAASLVTYPPP